MSADNCIAILKTYDKIRRYGEFNRRDVTIYAPQSRVEAYRVAYIHGYRKFKYYKQEELHNLGHWLYNCFGHARPIYSYTTALAIAGGKAKEAAVDYGVDECKIVQLDASEFNFPGC